MKRKSSGLFRLAGCGVLVLGLLSTARGAEPLTYQQALREIIQTYPTLTIAALQVEKARQNLVKVESTLGWNLTAEGGYQHDLSTFAVPVDTGTAIASLSRKLESGHSVGVNGRYRYEDNQFSFSPTLPNPYESTGLDLNYRVPFGRGKDNPAYAQGRVTAKAGVLLEQANEYAIRNRLAEQAKELFYGAATLQARYDSARDGVRRARRFLQYVRERVELGLAEETDRLQAEAQLQVQISEMKTLEVVWEQQRTTLNRLMGRDWEREFMPVLEDVKKQYDKQALPQLISESEANSPDLLRNKAVLLQSEAELRLQRDKRKNKLDLVVSLGVRRVNGDSAVGSIDERDMAGGVRLEYQNALDKRGLDAGIYQARLQKDIAEEESRKIRDDLKYAVAGLVAEINSSLISVESHTRRLRSEQKKLANALELYRTGRIPTDRLIQFENELRAAVFTLDQQKIEYEKRVRQLDILRGRIWQDMGTSAMREEMQ
ncbi:MAG TPA: TolC family protein [Chromatiales bacterium]|nr:TolC family protein [Chromatiales bacterium]